MTLYVSFQHLSTRGSSRSDFIMLSPHPCVAVYIHNLDQSHRYNWGAKCKIDLWTEGLSFFTSLPQWLFNTHITKNVALNFLSILWSTINLQLICAENLKRKSLTQKYMPIFTIFYVLWEKKNGKSVNKIYHRIAKIMRWSWSQGYGHQWMRHLTKIYLSKKG